MDEQQPTLAYEEHGAPEAPVVVLLHGYPLQRGLWRAQHALQDRCRLVLPDLPGFGESGDRHAESLEEMADRVAALLDRIGVTRAAVMGHSMGGYVALAFAERHRDRLSGFGMICSQAAADTEEARQQRLASIDRVRAEGVRVVADVMRERLFAEETMALHPELVDEVHRMMLQARPEGVIRALQAMAARPNRTDLLGRIDVPSLIVAGADDRVLPLGRSEEMARALPAAQLAVIPKAGHLAMLEQPEAFNRALGAFLDALKPT